MEKAPPKFDPARLIATTPLAWTYFNKFLNENQVPIEFQNHRFLLEPFADLHPDQVVKKSAQVGFSVTAILKSLWLAYYRKLNIIYALPTNDVIKGFVQPKVDSLIASNPKIAKMVTTDSVSLKQVGQRFIHFKGTGSQREAISTSADLLVIDEYDRAIDMTVVNTFDSRLQASEYGWRWRFSNPSGIGFGVDALYEDSDQMHWFVKCRECQHEWFMGWEKDGKCHWVDRESLRFACGKCDATISDDARSRGRWVPKYPNRTYRRGYWINQMMCPWVTAKRIVEQYNESNFEFFSNFVLGLAFTPSDLVVDRATIMRANAPSTINKTEVVMGVDQDAGGQYWVAMTPQGVFAYGYAKGWEEIENLKLRWDCPVVIDPAPYAIFPKQLAAKYPDVYLCYFKDSKGLSLLDWRGHIVYADRTRLFDIIASEISEGKLLFRQRPGELEEMIAHWNNLYRTTEEKDDGRTKSVWIKKGGRQSDYPFALAYARIALSRVIAKGDSSFIDPLNEDGEVTNQSFHTNEEVTFDDVLGGAVSKTFDSFD